MLPALADAMGTSGRIRSHLQSQLISGLVAVFFLYKGTRKDRFTSGKQTKKILTRIPKTL